MTLLLASFASVAFAQDPVDPAEPVTEEALPDLTITEEDEEAAAAAAKAEEEARKAEAALKAHKAKIAKLRKAAKGSTMAELTTRSGRTYKKVTIRSIDDVGLRIMHSSGTGRVKFADLPIRVQKKYGYDSAAAAAQAEREKAAAEARERATIARLRSEQDPKTTLTSRPNTTRPATTRPATTRPSTTRPSTTRPSTTRPGTTKEEPKTGVAAADDTEEIKALLLENKTLLASLPKIKELGDEYRDKAKKIEDKIFSSNAGTGRDPRIDKTKQAEADKWFEKANDEYSKIAEAKSKMRSNDRKIKKLRKAVERAAGK